MKTIEAGLAKFDSPEHAIESLLAAYRARDIDAMVAAKDFALDSQLFWEGLGLPVTDDQMKKSVVAFEKSFRDSMREQMPNYEGAKYAFAAREQLQTNLVVLTLECEWPNGQTRKLKLPVFKKESTWKTVLLPSFDHL
ncbi:MAG: hypothetical protein HZA92_08360 [Verrucomicrobia bacterium]|nr:hypothetical protein [Verrucomicrobiota bacterium]